MGESGESELVEGLAMRKDVWFAMHMGGPPKIWGLKTPNHPFVHRVFHYFHHPFLETPIYVWYSFVCFDGDVLLIRSHGVNHHLGNMFCFFQQP